MAQIEKKAARYSGQLTVKEYSDVELRDVRLETNDPVALGNFSIGPPREDEDLTFIVQYESEEDLICAFGHHHKRGFVLSGEDGRNHRIGCDCARSRYGIEWDTFVRRVDQQLERQKSLAWLHMVSKKILDAKPDILRAVNHPAVAAFDALRLHLRKMSRGVFRRCQEAAHSRDTRLGGIFKERDHKRERKNKEEAYAAYRKSLDAGTSSYERKIAEANLRVCEEPVYNEVYVEVLKIPGKTLFLSNHKMKPRLESMAQALLAQAETLSGPSIFSHPDLVAKSITDTASRFDSVLDEIDEAASVFQNGTLDLLQHWLGAEEFQGIRAARVHQGLEIREGNAEVFSLCRPRGLLPVPIRLAPKFRF